MFSPLRTVRLSTRHRIHCQVARHTAGFGVTSEAHAAEEPQLCAASAQSFTLHAIQVLWMNKQFHSGVLLFCLLLRCTCSRLYHVVPLVRVCQRSRCQLQKGQTNILLRRLRFISFKRMRLTFGSRVLICARTSLQLQWKSQSLGVIPVQNSRTFLLFGRIVSVCRPPRKKVQYR